jgi:hypothetical protein
MVSGHLPLVLWVCQPRLRCCGVNRACCCCAQGQPCTLAHPRHEQPNDELKLNPSTACLLVAGPPPSSAPPRKRSAAAKKRRLQAFKEAKQQKRVEEAEKMLAERQAKLQRMRAV